MSMLASHTHADRGGRGELLSSVQHLVNSQPSPMAPKSPSVSDWMFQNSLKQTFFKAAAFARGIGFVNV